MDDLVAFLAPCSILPFFLGIIGVFAKSLGDYGLSYNLLCLSLGVLIGFIMIQWGLLFGHSEEVPKTIIFRNRCFLTFFIAWLLTASIYIVLMLWIIVTENKHLQHYVNHKLAKADLLCAFLALFSWIFWLIALILVHRLPKYNICINN